ncbi:phenylalanine--tRNA ligase alpha subunit-like [Rhopilema esculentum]|uniref:phenylalanine--tRNA ligase alpha subunit-like n=1 Tax=Rhopilema esculentum TaxID=499914 RepID=UPI0031E379E0|eukprot:gene4901-21233_t
MASESISQLLLERLDSTGSVDTLEFAKTVGKEHQAVVGAIKSLQALGNVINVEQKQHESLVLTKEGQLLATNGSYEAIFYGLVPDEGLLQAEMKKLSLGENSKIGFSKAMSEGWIKIDKQAPGGARIFKKVDGIQDHVKENLQCIHNGDLTKIPESKMNELKKRKLVSKDVIKSFIVTKGSEFSLNTSKLETDLTPEMISSGSWKTKKFKDYNFDALGIMPNSGNLHPLMKVRAEFRQIFLEMGFTEMPTNNFVESSFWNFDALFQPQQHPARDAHDTFFLSEPEFAKLEDISSDYIERVNTIHSKGGYGSVGYQYDWKLLEAKKNLLRTHTTAVSAKMLAKLGSQDEFKPSKFFSIDRVFRNETLDATHLAEFHQIEGLVADYDLSLGHLIGILHQFFKKLGIEKLRFKPAYNPYTEPSMEVFSYHEGLKKWVEVGNSGIFRPEMLLPMGLPENVSVIAWGLSLERPTMIKYGISNIRDLIGHKVDLDMVQQNPICRLE